MQVVYSRRSLREVERIVRVIADDDPQAAIRFVAELEHRCALLSTTPEMGRERPEIGRAVRSLVHDNYSIFYRLRPEIGQAVIVSVWHSRRRPPRL